MLNFAALLRTVADLIDSAKRKAAPAETQQPAPDRTRRAEPVQPPAQPPASPAPQAARAGACKPAGRVDPLRGEVSELDAGARIHRLFYDILTSGSNADDDPAEEDERTHDPNLDCGRWCDGDQFVDGEQRVDDEYYDARGEGERGHPDGGGADGGAANAGQTRRRQPHTPPQDWRRWYSSHKHGGDGEVPESVVRACLDDMREASVLHSVALLEIARKWGFSQRF